jgi:hypothetical protein
LNESSIAVRFKPMVDRIAQLVEEPGGAAPGTLELSTRPLRGGLVARAVRAVTARYRDASGKRRVQRWVIKELAGRARREAVIYQALARTPAKRLAPSLLAVRAAEGKVTRLFIERMSGTSGLGATSWRPRAYSGPWRCSTTWRHRS